MRHSLIEACETIDAAMFSGDSFSIATNRAELQEYIDRWVAQLEVYQGLETVAKLEDEEDE